MDSRTKKLVAVAAIGAAALAVAAVVGRRRARTVPAPFAPIAAASDVVPAVADAEDASPATMAPVAAADGGLSPECARTVAANRAAFARARAGGCAASHLGLGCATTTAGVTWAHVVMSVHAFDDNGDPPDTGQWSDMQCRTEAYVRLVRIDASGGQVVGATSKLETAWYSQRSTELRPLVDYDGDGEIEVLSVLEGHDHEGGPVGELAILTFDGHAIGPYGPARALDVASVEDADGDGRPDVVTAGPYAGVRSSDAFGNDWPAGPAMFLAHSRPNGAFVVGDGPSVAFTRAKCPARPALSFSHDDLTFSNGAEGAIVCARLRGASEADVVRAWDAVCAPSDAAFGMPCEEWAKDLARLPPPFRL